MTARKRWLVGLAVLALLGAGIPVFAGADVTQFKSNGGSASTSWSNYNGNGNYESMSAQASESGKGSDRTVHVWISKYKRVSNAAGNGWSYANRYANGLMPNPKDFKISGKNASLDVDAESLPNQWAYSYQWGINPPPIPVLGPIGQVTLSWKANGMSSHKSTGHSVQTWTYPTTGETIKRTTNGQSTSDSADANGTFCGDYASTGQIYQNKNMIISVTKD